MADLLAFLLTAAITLVILGSWARLVLAALAWRGGFAALERGMPVIATVAGWSLRNLCRPTAIAHGFCLRAHTMSDLGRTRAAVESAEQMLRTRKAVSPDLCEWHFLTSAIDVFVNAGLYRHAVVVADAWTDEAREADDPAALELLEAAARHPYRGQSAGGLLLLGQTLERAGRADDAQLVYARALEEDPESGLCERIRSRTVRR